MARSSRLISLGLGVALALLGMNGAGFHFNTGRAVENQQRLVQSWAILQKLQETVLLLKDTELNQRAYFVTGKAQDLEPYRSAIVRLNLQVRELRQLTQDDPPQQARLRLLEPPIAQKLAELQTPLMLRPTQGTEAEKAALRLVQPDRGQPILNNIRQQLTIMAAEENRQVATRSQAWATAIHQTQLTFWGINGLTAILLTLVLYWVWLDRRNQIEVPFPPLDATLEQNQLWVEVPSIDLIHILEDSLRQLTGLLKNRDAEVRVARPLPVVQCDRSILLQMFTTLLRQALNRVPPGVRPVIKIYAEASPAWAYLWIEDNGSGVALEYQDRRDWTLDRGCEDETDGGIGVGGLTIVRQTLQPIGGQVGVEPLTQGNRFWIALPVRTACPHCAPDCNGSSKT